MQSMPLRIESLRHGFSAPPHPWQGPGLSYLAALRPMYRHRQSLRWTDPSQCQTTHRRALPSDGHIAKMSNVNQPTLMRCVPNAATRHDEKAQGNALGSGTTTINDQPLEEPKP